MTSSSFNLLDSSTWNCKLTFELVDGDTIEYAILEEIVSSRYGDYFVIVDNEDDEQWVRVDKVIQIYESVEEE